MTGWRWGGGGGGGAEGEGLCVCVCVGGGLRDGSCRDRREVNER